MVIVGCRALGIEHVLKVFSAGNNTEICLHQKIRMLVDHLLMALLGNWWRFRKWGLIGEIGLAPSLFLSLSLCPLAPVNLAFSLHYAFYPTIFCLTITYRQWN